jgi:sulfite exporter TauE/SafE
MGELIFRVKGMHCAACPALIEELLSQDAAVTRVNASLREAQVTVQLLAEPEGEERSRWNQILEPHGYLLLAHGGSEGRLGREYWIGAGSGLFFLMAFAALQATGFVSLFSFDTLEAPGALLLGVLASLSSCFALVGGVLLTFTAAVGRRNPKVLPAALVAFHLSRLLTFLLLGGVLGGLGSALTLDQSVFNVLFALAALTMILLGLNLLGVLPSWGGKREKTTGLSRRFASMGTVGGGILLGVATFFLPCGFTQTVQFQALAAGGFWNGGLLMGAFALGTLPVLVLVSFAVLAGLGSRVRAGLLAGSGVVVLGLGLFQLQSVLVLLRWIKPLLAF